MNETKNYFDLTGRLTKDITIRYTKDGKMIASSSIAVNLPKENVRFFDFIAWDEEAKKIEHLKKGQKIFIYGIWKDKEYQGKKSIELTGYQIIVIDTKKKNDTSFVKAKDVDANTGVIADPWSENAMPAGESSDIPL